MGSAPCFALLIALAVPSLLPVSCQTIANGGGFIASQMQSSEVFLDILAACSAIYNSSVQHLAHASNAKVASGLCLYVSLIFIWQGIGSWGTGTCIVMLQRCMWQQRLQQALQAPADAVLLPAGYGQHARAPILGEGH